MWQYLYKTIVEPISKQPQQFREGYFAGVLVAILVILCLLFIRVLIAFIFREKRCRSMVVKEKDGDFQVSADAVTDVIKSLQPEFSYIQINKIQLFRKSKKYRVLLHISFNTQGGGMPEQRAKLKERVKNALSEIFGLDSVKKVAIKCNKTSINGTIAPLPVSIEEDKEEDKSIKKPFVLPAVESKNDVADTSSEDTDKVK